MSKMIHIFRSLFLMGTDKGEILITFNVEEH